MADTFKFDPSDYLAPNEKVRYAVTRQSRTPIEFRRSGSGESGGFQSNNLLMNLLSHVISGINPGTISVDPYSPDNKDISATIRHESIHSLLSQVNPFGVGAADPRGVSGYDEIADAMKRGNRGGDPIVEVPAYAGSFEINKTPAEPSIRDAFVRSFASKLALSDPAAAEKYRLLAK